MNRRLVLTAGSLVAATALVLTGCSSIAQKATDAAVGNALGASVDSGDGQLSVTSSDGSMQVDTSGNGIDLPSTWPKEIPVADGKLTTVAVMGGDITASWLIDGSAKDAIAGYQKALESAGYKVTGNMATDSGATITAEGSGYSLIVTAGDAVDGQPASIGIIATASQPTDSSS